MNPADKSMSKYFIKIHFSIHLEESTGYQKELDTPNGKQIILIEFIPNSCSVRCSAVQCTLQHPLQCKNQAHHS